MECVWWGCGRWLCRSRGRNLPIILAGGGFDHGTYKAISRTPTKRTPLCNLYLTLLQEFGLKNQTYFGTSTGTFI